MSLDGDTLNLILAAGGFFVGGFALWFSLLGHGGFKERLRKEEPIRFDAAKALAAPKPWDIYLQTLEAALDTLTRWMGERARLASQSGKHGDWGQSANWCLTLAMIYPLTFLLLSWLAGNMTTIGEIELLPSPTSLPTWRRALLVLIVLATGIAFYSLLHHVDAINDCATFWFTIHLWQRIPGASAKKVDMAFAVTFGALFFALLYLGFESSLAVALFLAAALALTGVLLGTKNLPAFVIGGGALALAEALAGAGAAATAIAGIVVGFVAKAEVGTLILAVGGAGAIALVGVVVEGTAANMLSTTFFVVFLLLPFVNALFDWASWQVSRWLGDNLLKISRETGYPRWKRGLHYLKDIAIDGGFALACLIGLAWAIPRIISLFNGFVHWLSDETIIAVGDYLCAAAKEPLGDGLWATSMLFSTLLPTAIHFLFLLFAPLLWWLSPSEDNRARAAHLTHGHRPPDIDLRGKGAAAEEAWPTPMPTDYAAQALREDQAVFQGPLNETTLHAITIQLRFWRPLYYAIGLTIVGVLLYWLGGLFISSWRPVPEILLWIAHNFDYAPVRQCFPEALPTAPFETLAI